jgi:hypothetical protein
MNRKNHAIDGLPIHNDTPPTAFELATLATAFIVSGKCEAEAFKMAKTVFARAEEEVLKFETHSERRREEMLKNMPDIAADYAEKAELIHKGLGVYPPSIESFPLDNKDFIHGILPQYSADDRVKFFNTQVLDISDLSGKKSDHIEDIDEWNCLVVTTAKLRKWDDTKQLAKEAKQLHSKKRRSVKSYKLERRRK